MKFQTALILLFCTFAANAFIIEHSRVKRDESFYGKIKTGWSNFVSDVKNLTNKGVAEVKKVTNKGVEEIKNAFSKDRKVGDYRIDQLDVRFGEDDDENGTLSTTEPSNSINDDGEQLQRDKRDVEEPPVEVSMDDVEKNLEDQLKEQTTEGSSIKSTTLENNAEISPGYPPVQAETFSILWAPNKCADGQKFVNNRCRAIV